MNIPTIEQYFNIIYVAVIVATGTRLLFNLISAGIAFITSSGDAAKLQKAKKSLLSSFVGTIIVLGGYILLRTINPNLIEFTLPDLPPVNVPIYGPHQRTLAPELLGRVQEIAMDSKIAIASLEVVGNNILARTNDCDCGQTQSLCACEGEGESSSCKALRCYSGGLNQPCPSSGEIKQSQKNIIAWKIEIIYYGNRALREKEDLLLDIDKLTEEAFYYTEIEKQEPDPSVAEYYNQKILKLAEEIELKEQLVAELQELSDLTQQADTPAENLSLLPNQCLSQIESACKPSCSGDCFDTYTGCNPSACSGGNPCPTSEIQNNVNVLQNLKSPINNISDRILDKIQEIINFKNITIEL